MPHNICCFTRLTFSHEIKGGMEIHTRVLSEELVKRGHRVSILTTSLKPMKELVQQENGVEIHYLPVPNPAQYSKEFFDLSLRRFKQLHDQSPFNVIWSESAGALGYVKQNTGMYKIPMFLKLQGSHIGNIVTIYRSSGDLKKGLLNVLLNIPNLLKNYFMWYIPLIRKSRMIICPSPQTAKELRSETLTSKSKVYVSINGIDVDEFRPDPSKREKGRKILKLNDEDILVLNVGRITSDKGIDILLQAIAECIPQFPKIKVAIVGVGNERANLEQLSKNLGIDAHIRFLGFIPNENLPEYYNACDLFVCPTVRVESFGIVLAEAMACGKPVICSATGGTQYVVEDQISGLLVPVRKINLLVDAIKKIILNPKIASGLGVQARHRAIHHLSSNRMAKDTELVIDKIIY